MISDYVILYGPMESREHARESMPERAHSMPESSIEVRGLL